MYKYLYLILTLGFILRFISLGTVPPGISHDELENINNGISLIKTGHDLNMEYFPLSVGGLGLVAIPAYVAGVGAAIFGQSILGVRTIAALMGTVNILFLYFISKKLLDHKAALLASLLYAISPWGIHFSRMMYDPPVALFFALFAVSVLLYAKKQIHVFCGWLLLGLSAISYYGYIFTIPLVAVLLVFIKAKDLKLRGVVAGVLTLGIAYLVLLTMIASPNKAFGSERKSEIVFLQTERLSQEVDFQRSVSAAPEILDRIFINKATVSFRIIRGNYLGAFSPENIFSFGEQSKILSLENVGFLHLVDLPFILVGAYFLYKKSQRKAIFIFGMILISPLTMALSGERTFAARASLMFPFLLLLAGFGVWQMIDKYKLKAAVAIILLYALSSSAFMYQYFFRYPVYAKEIWFDSEKQVSLYLANNLEESILISTVEPRETFMEYMFYSRLNPDSASRAYKPDGDIFVNNFIFTNCIDPKDRANGMHLILDADCGHSFDGADELIKSGEGANSAKWGIFKSS